MSDTNTVIIGAGAAGLAVGACLQKQAVPFVLLERSDQVGQAWRNHYDRLHLHTDRSSSGLPFWPMPKSFPKYPKRAQVVEYLELYAGHFNLEPKFGQEVVSAVYQDGVWETKTGTAVYRSPNLVVATGYTRVPNIPDWPGRQDFQGTVLHSSAYKNGRAFAGKKVLVVGFGNSAAEIAIDLCEQGAEYVGMSVRHPVNVIPRDIVGLPILSVGKVMDYLPPNVADILAWPMIMLTIGDLTKYGLRKLPYGPNVQIRQDGQIPVLDIGTVKLIKNGRITIHPGLEQFTEDSVIFVNGAEEKVDAVILGTGYKPQVHTFLNGTAGLLNGDGAPAVSGDEAAPGLYFCGFYISPTGMLREIGMEAKRISKKISLFHRA